MLIGRKVELVFDPFDLTRIEVRWRGRSMGQRSGTSSAGTCPPRPALTTRHRPSRWAPGSTYLHLVEAQHTAELADRVQYAQLRDEPAPAGPAPHGHLAGQLPLPGTGGDDENDEAVSDATGEVLA